MALLVAASSLLVSLATFVPAQAHAAGPTFGMSPASGPAGIAPIFTQVDGCPAVPDGWQGKVQFVISNGTAQISSMNTDTDAAGNWGPLPLSVPTQSEDGKYSTTDSPPGLYTVAGYCETRPSFTDPYSVTQAYEPQQFTITGPSLHVSVTPATVLPGRKVTVTPQQQCPSWSNQVEIYLYTTAPGNFQATYAAAPGGTWPATKVPVPQSLPSGTTLWVTVSCQVARRSNLEPPYTTLAYATTPATVGPIGTYAALGDSYSSGEGIPVFLPGTDQATPKNRCHRSPQAYSQLLRGSPSFPSGGTFAACSGAKIANFYPGKGQYNEPGQLSSLLDKSVSLISATVGGNDVQFKQTLIACMDGAACQIALDGPTRLLIGHTIPRLKKLYKDILAAAPPSTQTYVLGYPHFFSSSPSLLCNLLDQTEALWMNSMEDLLNEGIARAIAQINSPKLHYVDTTYAFAGGELCSSSQPIYMNGFIGANWEYSFHPTAAGQAQLASALANAVRGTT